MLSKSSALETEIKSQSKVNDNDNDNLQNKDTNKVTWNIINNNNKDESMKNNNNINKNELIMVDEGR